MRRAAILVCLLALLVGCGTGKSASPGTLPPLSSAGTPAVPTPSSAAAPMATPSAQLLPPPAGAAETRDSATAFGRYWVDVLNDAYQRVDASTIAAISEPGCQTCRNYVASLAAAKTAAETYRGGLTTILDSVAAPIEDESTVVSVLVSAKGLDVLDRTGRVVRSQPAFPKFSLQVELLWKGARWRIAEVTKT